MLSGWDPLPEGDQIRMLWWRFARLERRGRCEHEVACVLLVGLVARRSATVVCVPYQVRLAGARTPRSRAWLISEVVAVTKDPGGWGDILG